MTYPGFLSRQSLVNFCQDKVAELTVESEKLYTALEVPGLSDEDWEVMDKKLTQNIGVQLGFRTVCEWAGQHTTPPVNGQKQLKESYDG